MDEATNKCLQDLASGTNPETELRRSEILTVGSRPRNRFCNGCVALYKDRGGSLREAIDLAASEVKCDLTAEDLHGIQEAIQKFLDREEEDKRRREELNRQQAEEQRGRRILSLHRVAGKRLAAATLDNYVADKPDQAKVLADVRDYVAHIKERVADGIGLVLNGPSGNGKDHLLISAARVATQAGFTVCWKNGQDLLAEFRDRIGTDESEEGLLAPLLSADVLVISDPLRPSGPLTDYQSDILYRVLDHRNRDCKPTWASMNVGSRKEADARMGVAIVDRMRHGALCLACSWPSYRQPYSPTAAD